MKNESKAIDLFCGCGGISLGLQMAGCKVLAGIDIEPNYLQTYRHNFGEKKGAILDLSKIAPEQLFKDLGIKKGDLDFIVGGPPCQGFSKNVPRAKRLFESTNNLLVKTFLDYCIYAKPRFILMENVAEMSNGFEQAYTNEIIERLQKVGYSVNHSVLNAADFGVPQRRRRAFFIAYYGLKMPSFPDKTHSKNILTDEILPLKKHITVWDAIGDLPALKHNQGVEPCNYSCPPFSEFQKKVRCSDNKVFNHIARKLQPRQLARLSSIKPGQGLMDLPDDLRPKSGYSGAYGRLTKNMVAPTITRWVFHPGSGRWGHPVDIRTITIREAARIQGFLDSFRFNGTYTQQAGQVGNAAPPILISAIVKHLLVSS